MINNIVILAAGLGSRLGLEIPKCLITIKNKKIIDYQLDLIKHAKNITIVTGYKASQIKDHVSLKWPSLNVNYINNGDFEKTNNVYSLSLAFDKIDTPTLIMMSDLLISRKSFEAFINKSNTTCPLIAITKKKSRDSVQVKVKQNKAILISREIESEYEWVGMYYTKNLIVDIGASYIYELASSRLPSDTQLIESHEIDTPEDLLNTKRLFQET